jgi:drug/metabolite transporter (DMT)-like permease
LGEKVDVSCWIAVVVGFIGVIIMLRPGSNMFEPAALLALLTAIFYAVASIITRRLGKTDSGVSMAFYLVVMYIFFGTIFSLILNGIAVTQTHPSLDFLIRDWRFPTREDLIFLMAIGVIAAVGFYCLSQAYRLAHPSVIAPFEYIAVPLGVVWGYLFFKDVIDYRSVLGIVLIVGSGLYIFKRKNSLTIKYASSTLRNKK